MCAVPTWSHSTIQCTSTGTACTAAPSGAGVIAAATTNTTATDAATRPHMARVWRCSADGVTSPETRRSQRTLALPTPLVAELHSTSAVAPESATAIAPSMTAQAMDAETALATLQDAGLPITTAR
jgi:hypothetical protein